MIELSGRIEPDAGGRLARRGGRHGGRGLPRERAPPRRGVPDPDRPDARRRRHHLHRARVPDTGRQAFSFAGEKALLVYDGAFEIVATARPAPGGPDRTAPALPGVRRRALPAARHDRGDDRARLGAGAGGRRAADDVRRSARARPQRLDAVGVARRREPADGAAGDARARPHPQPDALRVPAGLGDDRLLRQPVGRRQARLAARLCLRARHHAQLRRTGCQRGALRWPVRRAAAASGGPDRPRHRDDGPRGSELRLLRDPRAGGARQPGRRRVRRAPAARCSWV